MKFDHCYSNSSWWGCMHLNLVDCVLPFISCCPWTHLLFSHCTGLLECCKIMLVYNNYSFTDLGGLTATGYDYSISFWNSWTYCTSEPERWASAIQEAYSKGSFQELLVLQSWRLTEELKRISWTTFFNNYIFSYR